MFLEGGESNHSNDRGGHTKFGITQKLYDKHRDKYKKPHASVAGLTTGGARLVYREEFYKPVEYCDNIERHYNYFDMCVNSGYRNYKKMQIENPADIYKYRKDFFSKIAENDSSQKVFLRGWLNRLDVIKTYFETGLKIV